MAGNAIVVPMFNEESNVRPLVEGLEEVLSKNNISCDIVLLNDGSADRTLEEMRGVSSKYDNIKIVSNKLNQGFAKILREGIQYCIQMKYEVLVFMDGDLTHNPKYLPDFFNAIENADIVIGSRYTTGGGMKDVPFHRVLISQLGNIFFRLMLGLNVRDATSGYRAVRSTVLKRITLEEDSFVIQLEEVVKARRAGAKMTEIPIILTTRVHGKSKFNLSLERIMEYVLFTLKTVSGK